MGIEKAIEILRDWVDLDRRIREQDPNTDFSNLDNYNKFCEMRNLAIEKVLEEIEELKGVILK